MDTMATSSKQKKTSNILFPLITLMLANGLIALIFLFFTKNFNYNFIVNGEPAFALNKDVLMWISFGFLIILGLAPYFLFNLSAFKTDRYGLKLNYSLYYSGLLLFLMWSFFSFTLSLPIVGVIILGLAIILWIFVVYRFMTNSITSGIILTLFCLWLIYLFILNFAFVLLK